MVKFDPEGFTAMMARIKAEEREKERQATVLRSPFEDMEPDYEYMQAMALSVLAATS